MQWRLNFFKNFISTIIENGELIKYVDSAKIILYVFLDRPMTNCERELDYYQRKNRLNIGHNSLI